MTRPSLWFIVPAHGRTALAAICLRQLRRTCDQLAEHEIDATAVVIADQRNLVDLRQLLGRKLLGFGTVERDNRFLSRRFNDGIQLALDPAWNGRPADYVVPIGSDDWIDHRILLDLPGPDMMVGFQRMSFVREDGSEISTTHVSYTGGCGIRIYPRQLMAGLGYRPADESLRRGCDTSILTNLQRHHGDTMRIEHRHLHDRQIVDWKSQDDQVTSYQALTRHRRTDIAEPFEDLAGVYPEEALEEMRVHYATRRLVAA